MLREVVLMEFGEQVLDGKCHRLDLASVIGFSVCIRIVPIVEP